MKTAVIYARVSTSSQDTQSQVSELHKYANDNSIKVVKIYKEEISGLKSYEERKELLNMVNYVITNKINSVLIWEISRLSRKTKITLEVIDLLSDNKINLYIHKDRQNTLNEDGTINHNTTLLISILSSIENNDITKQIDNVKNELNNLNKEDKIIDKQVSFLLDNLSDNNDFMEVFTKKIKVLKTSKNTLKKEIVELENRLNELKEFAKLQNDLNNMLKHIKKDAHLMKDYLDKIIKRITIYPCDNAPLMSNVGNDVSIYIEFELYSSIEPVKILVSRYSRNKVVMMGKGDYNKNLKKVVRKKEHIQMNIKDYQKILSKIIK